MLMALYEARAKTIVFCLSRVDDISPMMVYVEGPMVQLYIKLSTISSEPMAMVVSVVR
jgi:hypothetical protein